MAYVVLIILVGLPTYLFWRGLKVPSIILWRPVAIGLVLVGLSCAVILYIANMGVMGTGIAFVVTLIMIATDIIAGVILAFNLKGRRKLWALLMVAVYSILAFLTIQIGNSYPFQTFYSAEGDIIVQALNNYHADSKAYPTTLADLVPAYLPRLKQPDTLWGWLYKTETDGFLLGYVGDIDPTGYRIGVYNSSTAKWSYQPDGKESFILPATPTFVPSP